MRVRVWNGMERLKMAAEQGNLETNYEFGLVMINRHDIVGGCKYVLLVSQTREETLKHKNRWRRSVRTVRRASQIPVRPNSAIWHSGAQLRSYRVDFSTKKVLSSEMPFNKQRTQLRARLEFIVLNHSRNLSDLRS
jgi:hypothetical protein